MGTSGAAAEAPHTGTTIVAVQYDGGVVVGADSRVSTGAAYSHAACQTRILQQTALPCSHRLRGMLFDRLSDAAAEHMQASGQHMAS